MRDEELSYFISSSSLQKILRIVEESKTSIIQLPLRAVTLNPYKNSLLKYVREQLSLQYRSRSRSKLFLLGGILLMALLTVRIRSSYRAWSVFYQSSLLQRASRQTSHSVRILNNVLSRKSVSMYRYIISFVYNLIDKLQGTFPKSHSQTLQREIASLDSLVRMRAGKILQLYSITQEKPPMRLNLEESLYNQVHAICDLLEAFLLQRTNQAKNGGSSYYQKTSPVHPSMTQWKSKTFKPLESKDYNIQSDKENDPCDAYEKLNNAIALTEKMTQELETD